ncbi:2,5-diketo-D-gluconate reductase A [Asanoa ferruginea]|uniref:2,5-diketo-D-gluconate reductase A n=1 Tax=Asanoa ferruginea TaxID=53367 RepID=A0A3D9ZSN5_9ACTN|nr:aldo/keto reductase [Asanoa ferruginea]REG00252.1 2,5-diketo-D-gluconate reductase A [Asanoa ferruginea]GIF46049.1 oxidoreductase [Asanoa ferruginea]
MAKISIPTRTLNDGYQMPWLGLGTWPLQGRQLTDSILAAIELGYRLIDTASRYGNEDAVGAAIRESGLPREDFFVTTKLAGRDQGKPYVREGFSASLERLGLDYVDLYLIHWPLPLLGRYVESYVEMVALQQEGLIRSVGVSNFLDDHIAAIVAATGVQPAVDQIQVSPTHAQVDVVEAVSRGGTVVQAWRPLERNGGILEHPTVTGIADRLGVAPSQVVLRWLIERDITTTPHSSNPDRQRLNADIFEFSLEPADVAAITALDVGAPVKQDPKTWEEF